MDIINEVTSTNTPRNSFSIPLINLIFPELPEYCQYCPNEFLHIQTYNMKCHRTIDCKYNTASHMHFEIQKVVSIGMRSPECDTTR